MRRRRSTVQVRSALGWKNVKGSRTRRDERVRQARQQVVSVCTRRTTHHAARHFGELQKKEVPGGSGGWLQVGHTPQSREHLDSRATGRGSPKGDNVQLVFRRLDCSGRDSSVYKNLSTLAALIGMDD